MQDNQSKTERKKLFLFLWVLCLIGYWSVLPYVQHLQILPPTVSVFKVILLGTVQAVLVFGLVCWLSYKLVPKTDLHPFVIKNVQKQIIYPGVLAGVLAGLIIYILDRTVFQNSLVSPMHPPFWAGALASLYGGINEEVLLRLFLFTLIYFLFRKICKFASGSRLYFLWITNIIVALIFGLGHLPALFKLATPNSFEISRVLILNGIPGLVFGYLYWSRGLWAAMLAHFVTDLMIHVFLLG